MENNNAISWILAHYLNLKKILYICAKLLFLSELFARMIWTNFLCPKLCRYKLFSFCNSGSSALQCGDECWCMLFLKELFCPTQERNCPAGPVDLGIARPGEKCRVRRSRRPWRGGGEEGGEEGWGGGDAVSKWATGLWVYTSHPWAAWGHHPLSILSLITINSYHMYCKCLLQGVSHCQDVITFANTIPNIFRKPNSCHSIYCWFIQTANEALSQRNPYCGLLWACLAQEYSWKFISMFTSNIGDRLPHSGQRFDLRDSFNA